MGPDTWGGLVTLERGRHATLKHQNSSEVPVLGTKLPSLSSGQPPSIPVFLGTSPVQVPSCSSATRLGPGLWTHEEQGHISARLCWKCGPC